MIVVSIEYVIDPFQVREFEEYAQRWLEIIPGCGGELVGYFLPHEGTNNVALALIGFDNLASYESYRTRLRVDEAGAENFKFAFERRFILEERRTFLRKVERAIC